MARRFVYFYKVTNYARYCELLSGFINFTRKSVCGSKGVQISQRNQKLEFVHLAAPFISALGPSVTKTTSLLIKNSISSNVFLKREIWMENNSGGAEYRVLPSPIRSSVFIRLFISSSPLPHPFLFHSSRVTNRNLTCHVYFNARRPIYTSANTHTHTTVKLEIRFALDSFYISPPCLLHFAR